MPVSLLYGCCQIETCTADLSSTRHHLETVLGAVRVEQMLAQQIAALLPNTGYAVDHLECGGAVFQINQPASGMQFGDQRSIHQAYLDAWGPCVTNLNFYVDDIEAARELLQALGAPVHIEGPSDVAQALGDYGPDNTREGAARRPFLFMGTRHLIGFDLEIMEPNFRRLQDQRIQFPAFVEPRPAPLGDLKLMRLVVMVPDLVATCHNLTKIFAPASCSRPYNHAETGEYSAVRVWLGGMEIEYRQIRSGNSASRDFASAGGGVCAITFASLAPHVHRARNDRWETLTAAASGPARLVMRCYDEVGFDFILEAADTDYRPC